MVLEIEEGVTHWLQPDAGLGDACLVAHLGGRKCGPLLVEDESRMGLTTMAARVMSVLPQDAPVAEAQESSVTIGFEKNGADSERTAIA